MSFEPETSASWEKLVAARRRVDSGIASSRDEAAPFGFAQRIAAHAMELRRHERLAWWTHWSMRAGIIAGIAAALMALFNPAAGLPAPFLAAPALDIPLFSSP
jgi:hypothetical protein